MNKKAENHPALAVEEGAREDGRILTETVTANYAAEEEGMLAQVAGEVARGDTKNDLATSANGVPQLMRW